jgi:hypothetical protein
MSTIHSSREARFLENIPIVDIVDSEQCFDAYCILSVTESILFVCQRL